MNGIGQIVEGINASFEALKNNRVRKLYVLKNIDNDVHNFVLSGGINSQNVDNALKTNSWCLDLNSGVESQTGIKDIHLIKDILKTIRNYDI